MKNENEEVFLNFNIDDENYLPFKGYEYACEWCPLKQKAIEKTHCERGAEYNYYHCGVTEKQLRDLAV